MPTVSAALGRYGLAQRVHRDLLAIGCLLLLTLAWDWGAYDLAVSRWFGSEKGFVLKNHLFLEIVLHDYLQQLARFGVLFMILMVFLPLGWFKQMKCADRVHAVLACVLCALLVVGLKSLSFTSCPWALAEFGGTGHYVSHWMIGVTDGGGGRCFPGGHSSSGFAYIALALWLRGVSVSASRWVFCLSAAIGMLLGWVQVVRGAHFFSHALWSWLLCWMFALGYYSAVHVWRKLIVVRQ